MTITETISALEQIKAKYGDLEVCEVFYGSEDYPKTEVEKIEPTVIKTTISDDYIVVFQDQDQGNLNI